MILFEEDWLRYPEAIADYETRNKSFVRFSGLLKSMGISNHLWPLALIHKELQGIDPFDEENLTYEQKLTIAKEIKMNPIYYLREIARAPSNAGSEIFVYKANRANMAMFWAAMNHLTSLVIQPRQTGKSFGVDQLMTMLMNIVLMNTKMNLLTKDDDLRVKNLKRLKDIADELPSYLRLRSKSDASNMEKMTVNKLNNVYNTSVPQASPKAALGLGRGSTFAINHIDEIAFIKNIDITLPALLAAAGE